MKEQIEKKIRRFREQGIEPWLSEEEREFLDGEGWDFLPLSFVEAVAKNMPTEKE